MNNQVEIIDEEEYIIFFVNPINKELMFLGYMADIDSLCYHSNLILPGTTNYRAAKRYKTVEEAKDDIYKLRYHHREFLKITLGIKKVLKSSLDIDELTLSNSLLT